MAPSGRLSLFPPVTTSMPQKSILKQPAPRMDQSSPNELKGVAIQVSALPARDNTVQPQNTHVKHPLLPLVPKIETFTGAGRQNNTQPSQSFAQRPHETNVHTTEGNVSLTQDVLAPLPQSRVFGASTAVGRQPSVKLHRPKVPANIAVLRPSSVSGPPDPKDDDRLSPLPNVTQFRTSPQQKPRNRTSMSEHSGSPTLVRSDSGASSRYPASPPAMRSMFPQYDPSRPLSEQNYYPTPQSATPSIPSEKVSKIGSPVDAELQQKQLVRAETFIDGYEHIPRASSKDMLELWKASCCHFPVSARKLLLNLSQPKTGGTCLALGASQGESLYTMAKDSRGRLAVQKHCPDQPSFTPVAHLVLPNPDRPRKEKDSVPIFPQMAAVHAQGKSANPLAAASSSTPSEPTSNTAISEAFIKYTCQLIRNARKHDSLGAVTASYTLKHPFLGSFPITITKSTAGNRHPNDPRAKISLHHFSAPPAAIKAETLVLAFLDFARDACVLDTPALLALDAPYVIDTFLTALLAVAAIENDVLMAETMTFAPPPTTPLPQAKKSSSYSTSSGGRNQAGDGSEKRKSLFRRKKQKTPERVEEELPALTQGALAVLGLSFKTAVWVLETGVKVTAGVVIGVSHLASKA